MILELNEQQIGCLKWCIEDASQGKSFDKTTKEIIKSVYEKLVAKNTEDEKESIIENLTDKQTELLQNKHAEDYMGTDDDMPDSFEEYLVNISLEDLKNILSI